MVEVRNFSHVWKKSLIKKLYDLSQYKYLPYDITAGSNWIKSDANYVWGPKKGIHSDYNNRTNKTPDTLISLLTYSSFLLPLSKQCPPPNWTKYKRGLLWVVLILWPKYHVNGIATPLSSVTRKNEPTKNQLETRTKQLLGHRWMTDYPFRYLISTKVESIEHQQ